TLFPSTSISPDPCHPKPNFTADPQSTSCHFASRLSASPSSAIGVSLLSCSILLRPATK
ncbi:hypothetical protein HAX54_021319, partial [Datura stramonium]|nr:hypothetical protein [Datura stramonium]